MIRQPAVAGTFYPAEPDVLRQSVAQMTSAAPAHVRSGPVKALIVPHAGYVYSGGVAGAAYAELEQRADEITRVVLLGPVHRVPVRGLALPEADRFATPLGTIPLDREAVARLAALPQVVVSGPAHRDEHSLEVQLPFLQSVLGQFTLVPLAVGDASPSDVAEVLETLWGGPETLIVISSDLSHYLTYAEARARDHYTVERILGGTMLQSHEQACGATPINGLLKAAGAHGLEPHLIAQCNSGDTAGDRAHVVGYAAIGFAESAHHVETGSDARARVLLPLARAAISTALGVPRAADGSASWLDEPGACFVTLTQNGELRGCIGSVEAYRSLREDVRVNARNAALGDPRFMPLTLAELDDTRIEISLLSPLEPLHFTSEADALAKLRPGIDGLVLEYGDAKATFLPQVWESLPAPRDFVGQLKRKAGLPADFWSDRIRLSRYHVTKMSEPESRPTRQ